VPIQHAQVGHDASAENNTGYKKFVIDMKVAKRPVTQCMIRNTVIDILKLVVDSVPVNVDTSVENTERINALAYPDRVNQRVPWPVPGGYAKGNSVQAGGEWRNK